jgi:hypothetical protein
VNLGMNTARFKNIVKHVGFLKSPTAAPSWKQQKQPSFMNKRRRISSIITKMKYETLNFLSLNRNASNLYNTTFGVENHNHVQIVELMTRRCAPLALLLGRLRVRSFVVCFCTKKFIEIRHVSKGV